MRLERLAKLLETVQLERSLTAEELARQLDVSRRTLFRDIRALAIVGVPIVYDRTASAFRLSQPGPHRSSLTAAERAAIAELLDDRRVAAQHRRAVQALKKLIGNVSLADLAPRPPAAAMARQLPAPLERT